MIDKYNQIMRKTPVEIQMWKYNPTQKLPRYILFTKIFGFFLGLNIYLYTNKIYQDEFKLRERGYP